MTVYNLISVVDLFRARIFTGTDSHHADLGAVRAGEYLEFFAFFFRYIEDVGPLRRLLRLGLRIGRFRLSLITGDE